MLSADEEDYINKIPNNKKVFIKPYDKSVGITANSIIKRLQNELPGLEIKHMGASALEISGQNDIDIYIFSKPNEFDKYIPIVERHYGKPESAKYDSIAWKFVESGFDIELYLTDPTSNPMKKQIEVFEVLKKQSGLREEYEALKESLNGKSFKEYQKKKYEFYHRILDQ